LTFVPLNVPNTREPAALADWAELVVITTDDGAVSSTLLERLLEGEGSDLAEEELALDAAEDDDDESEVEFQVIDEGRDEREVGIEQLLDEIELRLDLGPKVYPFERKPDGIIRRSPPGEAAYLLLLALSWRDAPCRAARRVYEGELAFDNLALEALRRYLGRNAIGVRFARNAHDPEDDTTRPKKFIDAIAWLRERIKLPPGQESPPDEERVPHWEDELGSGPAPLNSYKDGGVDVVAWWRFKDERPGAPVLLAQCTCQMSWGSKDNDIRLNVWGAWINFATVPPQTALVIPFAVERDASTWFHHTLSAGVIIDRHRLLELLDELEDEELRKVVDDDARAWAEGQLSAAA
jgi:hypothetical protein